MITAQGNSSAIYNPREQITLKDCDAETDKNKCLYDLLGNALKDIINTELKKLRIQEDTVTISLGFSLTKKGRIDKLPIRLFVSNEPLQKNTFSSMANLIQKLPRFDITNRKPEQYRSLHIFDYTYIIEKNDLPYKSILLETKQEYEGGTIVELPVFPGCEHLSYQETADCFTRNMKQHISKFFEYPEDALKSNIQGKVYILFTIDQEGKIVNIRTEGGVYILQEEAIRIIELLPRLRPALENGIPTKIPFSVPIKFSLGIPK